MNSNKMARLGGLWCGCAVLLVAADARAEWMYFAGLGAAYTDNSIKVAGAETAETTVNADLGVTGEQISQRLETKLASNLAYVVHRGDTANEVRGGVDGTLLYRALPDYLHFTLSENFGQIRQNVLLPDTAINRTNFNIFSAGANVIAPLSKRSSLVISGIWSENDYGQQQTQSTRLLVSASLQYALSLRSYLSLTASDAKTQFTHLNPESDYRIQEATLGYNYKFEKAFIEADVGKTQVKYESPTRPPPDPQSLYRLSLSRNFGAYSTVQLYGGSSYADSASSFVLEQNITGVDTTLLGGEVGTDAFKTDYAYLNLAVNGTKTAFDLSVGGQRISHDEQATLDSKSRSAQIGITRRLSPRVSISLGGLYEKQTLAASQYEPRELSTTLSMDWLLSRAISFSLGASHADGVIGLDGGHYKSNSVSARFRYTGGGR